MNQSRIAVALAVVAVLAGVAGIAFNAVSNPYAARRAQLAERLKEIPAPSDPLDGGFKADYANWKSTVDGRVSVWDSLVPPPPPPVAKPDPSKEVEGIAVLKGSSGSGATAKVRLSSPGNERGKMFKVGDAVTSTVTIQEVTPNQIIFKVNVGGQTVNYPMSR